MIPFNSFSFLEFIKFVSQQEECRKKWLAAENEAVRLKQGIAKITVRSKGSPELSFSLDISRKKHLKVLACLQCYRYFQVNRFHHGIYPFLRRLKMKHLK